MDHKAVIEEQIRELQKVQDKIDWGQTSSKIALAKAISELSIDAANLYVRDN